MKKFNLLLLGLSLSVLAVHAAVPSRIVYQGRLSKSGVGAAGRHTITVQFVDKDGNNLSQSQTFTVDIPTTGDFSLEIDHIPPDADWINGLPKMRVIVGGETLTPDQAFSASPYALVARNVENMDTTKVKLAGSKTGALLSSWQLAGNEDKIDAKVIVGTVPYVVPDNILPSKIQDTAVVLTSSVTQTIQPRANVVPLTVKSNPTVDRSLNLFEAWDYSSVPTERFHIQGTGNTYFNGNVGIGTEDPSDKLDLFGGNMILGSTADLGGNNYGSIKFRTPSGIVSLRSSVSGLFGNVGTRRGLALDLQNDDTSAFEIVRDAVGPVFGVRATGQVYMGGNLGIGTATPGEALDVRGNVKLGNIRALTPTNWGYSAGYPVVMLGPSSGRGTVSIGYDPAGNPDGRFTGDGQEVLFRNGAQFVTPNSANNAFHSNQVVLKDGNVGINKADPTKPLDVGGDANITGIITSASVGINNPSPTKALDVVGDANITGKITGATFGFGGMFVVIPENAPSSRTNPFTGDFTCPAGFGAHSLGTFSDHSGRGAEITLCVK